MTRAHWKCIFPLAIIISALLLKLWLDQDRFFVAHVGYIHDDGLYYKTAVSIVRGEWLGPGNNNLTLLRGPGYPLFIAASVMVGIPLSFATQLLYITACFFFFLAMRAYTKNLFLSAVSASVLLIDPQYYLNSYVESFSRQSINVSVSIIIASASLALMSPPREWYSQHIWSLILGTSYGYFSLIRGEYIWVIPLMICTIAWLFFHGVRAYLQDRKIAQALSGFVSILFVIFGSTYIPTYIKSKNVRQYGAFITDELSSSEMRSAYKALARVKPKTWLPHIPVSTETRMKIYEKSPTFALLEPALEGSLKWGWTQNSLEVISLYTYQSEHIKNKEAKEIAGGWFIFALRDAVAITGYYNRISDALEYYSQLGKEINMLCDTGQLECYSKYRSFGYMPPLAIGHLHEFKKAFMASIQLISSAMLIKQHAIKSYGDVEVVSAAGLFVNESKKVAVTEIQLNNNHRIQRKISIINAIGNIYATALPMAASLSIFSYALRAFHLVKTRCLSGSFLYQSGVLLSVVALVTIISLIEATSFPAVFFTYLAPAHTYLIIFILTSFLYVKVSMNIANKNDHSPITP